MINQFYSENYISKRLKDYNFKNFKVTDLNKKEIAITKDYANKCINNEQGNGLIITGDSGVGKTHLTLSISNELIKIKKNFTKKVPRRAKRVLGHFDLNSENGAKTPRWRILGT